MKKIGKILFTFAFLFTGIFGITSARAEGIPINYYDYNITNYKYKLASGSVQDGGKIENIVQKSLDLQTNYTRYSGFSNEQQANFENALRNFYNSASSATSVGVTLFKVYSNQDFLDTDSMTFYAQVPKAYYGLNFASGTVEDHIYLAKFNDDLTAITDVYSVNGKKQSDGSFVPVAGSKVEFLDGTFEGGNEYISDNEFFSNRYVSFTTNNVNSKKSTYYALIICNAPKYELKNYENVTPDQVVIPEDTTTTTTTIENPKTLDGNNQAYIIIGVIGLIGILGLGTKFAKASK